MSTDRSFLEATSRLGAMPEAVNAIRCDFNEGEPPALIFNERASPGALVSWAWSQLSTLDTLLIAQRDRRPSCDQQEVAEAVRAIIGPVMNALRLSERRGYELRKAAGQSSAGETAQFEPSLGKPFGAR